MPAKAEKNSAHVGSMIATVCPGSRPRRAELRGGLGSAHVKLAERDRAQLRHFLRRGECARGRGSPSPRRRRISVSDSAARIFCSSSGRRSTERPRTGELATSSIRERSSTGRVFVDVLRGGWPQPCPPLNSLRQRRARAAERRRPYPGATSAPRARDCRAPVRARGVLRFRGHRDPSRPRELPSSPRSWRTVARACASTMALRSSFVPVAPTMAALGSALGSQTRPADARRILPRSLSPRRPGSTCPPFARGTCEGADTWSDRHLRPWGEQTSNSQRGTFVPGPIEPIGLSTLPMTTGIWLSIRGALTRLECLHLHHPHAHERPAPPPAAHFFFGHSLFLLSQPDADETLSSRILYAGDDRVVVSR